MVYVEPLPPETWFPAIWWKSNLEIMSAYEEDGG